ncbi:uncharacterized protein LOC119728620 [Patiria miniata]|uniref:Uncharacterized protein n=1 Tax=Patiria miniata TaxID=46514 RepID=A0A913ZZ62_PATMI|nr:uncharacterized protein LOC119728620 [Patiria miniata]
MAHSSATARGKGGFRAGTRDSVQLKIAQLTETSDGDRGHINPGSDRESSFSSSHHRQFNKDLGTRPSSPRAVGNTRTGSSCGSTTAEDLHRGARGHHRSSNTSHDHVSRNQDRQPAIESSYGAAEPSLALSNKQSNVPVEHGKDKEHAWNIIGGNSRQTQAAGGGSKYSNRILAGDLSRQENKDTSYRHRASSPVTTTTVQTGLFGTATSASAGRDSRGISSVESRTVHRGQSPASIQERRAVARRVGAFMQHEQSPTERGYSQGNVHSKVNTSPPITSPQSPDSVSSSAYSESGITSPGQTRQIFKPLAVKRLTKTTKKNLTSFDELQSPVSSPYSSRRSSVSSIGTVDQSEGSSVAENRARLVSAFVLSTQNNTATSRYRDWSGTHGPGQSNPLKVDNVRRTMARNQDSPTSASDPSSPQLSESGGTKLTLRMDFNSLKIGSVENLKSQSRPATLKKVASDKGLSSMSAPTSPVRTLQKLTNKMRNRKQEYTDIPQGDYTRPMSPASEPGEDEGCVRDFDWPTATQSLPRPRRKNRMVIPELPEVLLARNKEVSDGTQASSLSPMDKFNLKAPLRPLNVKRQSENTPVSSPVMDTMVEETSDELLLASTRKKERRKKFSALGQSVTEGSGGSNGENGRSRSDPTQDRKRGSFSEDIEKSSVDSQFFEALQIQGVHGQIPPAGTLGATVASTESSQSISSMATSISDTTAEQQFINVLHEVTHHPDGLINSSNLDSQERNGKLKSKVKSRTWPNGDKSQNELDQYTQGIQVCTSSPTVSDRQEEIDKLHMGEEPDDMRAKSENLLAPGGKERVNLQLALDSPHSPQIQRKRSRGGSGYEELPESTSGTLLHQGSSSEQSLIQQDKHMRSASEPATTLSPVDDTTVPSLCKPVVTITRSQSMGPNQHQPQERKFPMRKKAIIPPPQPGHSLRPVMQAHMSESTPNLAAEPHTSRVTDALVSPTISKSNRILSAKIGSSTLPRSNKDKSVELSPTTRRKLKQQVS